mmetsp:Transcript_17751/g.54199  ORF Transcript_17751/g.54199 Transcript_17751/m.54199 type:complete len:157 (-) Transcript_17751:385-855(-)
MLFFLATIAPFVFAVVAFPPIVVIVPFLVYFVFRTLRYVTHTMSELKRLDGVTRSTVLSVVTASLSGLSPIRALGSEDVQTDAFLRALTANARSCFFWLASQRFFSFTIDCAMTTFIAVVVVVSIAVRSFADPTLLAIALVYSLQLVIYVQVTARR